MKSKIKNSLGIILMLASFLSNAQSQVFVDNTEDMLDRMRLKTLQNSDKVTKYDEIGGQAYYPEGFAPGLVKIRDDQEFRGEYRYDMYEECIEFRINNKVFELTSPSLVEYVRIGEKYFKYLSYLSKIGNEEEGFFEIVVEGNVSLLYRPKVLFKKAEAAKLYQDAKPPSFVHISDPYYVKVEGGIAERVSSKKSLINVLSAVDHNISDYIKKEKISANKSEDLIKVIAYINR